MFTVDGTIRQGLRLTIEKKPRKEGERRRNAFENSILKKNERRAPCPVRAVAEATAAHVDST